LGFADGFASDFVASTLGFTDLLTALLFSGEDLIEGPSDFERGGGFDFARFEGDAELVAVDPFDDVSEDGLFETGFVFVDSGLCGEARGRVIQGVIDDVFEQVGKASELEGVLDRVTDAVFDGGTNVHGVAISGEGVAIDTWSEVGEGAWFDALGLFFG